MILIAESKTMADGSAAVARPMFEAHKPLFEDEADRLMDSLRGMTSEQLAEAAGITPGLARTMARMVNDFPYKGSGVSAIEAFTGVVFRQLRLPVYDGRQRDFLNGNVRIISSLYGWLRPDDIIKPYRLDFSSKIAPGGGNMIRYWRGKVTEALVAELQATGDRMIIDLMPGDAAKCIDWKTVGRYAEVYRADFKVQTDAGALRTPNAGRLKTLRGQLLDMIISGRVNAVDEIAGIEGSDFAPAETDGGKGVLSYLTA